MDLVFICAIELCTPANLSATMRRDSGWPTESLRHCWSPRRPEF